MDGWWRAAASAFWLGLFTSISPCPLATNIAALSFVGRRADRPGAVLITGLLYTVGRTATYLVALAVLLVTSVLAAPAVSHFPQTYLNRLLGPVLILVGMVLLNLLPLRLPGLGGTRLQQRAASWGPAGAALLGIVFALSFCPVSAALFFGSLLPLAIRHESPVALPALYGVGTALPVLGFAVLLAAGAHRVGAAFGKLGQFERWARRATGGLFLAIGLYYALRYSLALR